MLGGLLLAGCSSGSSNSNEGVDGGTSGTDGGASGTDGGTSHSDGGTSGTDGGTPTQDPVLPAGTLLYLRHDRSGSSVTDSIIARDLSSGNERVVTDLTGDGSSGWEIRGMSLSPDRRRIAFASLYDPTTEDTATGLATRAIWTVGTGGVNFRRLTPTFPNDSQGRSTFSHDVDYPEWTADGAEVVYDFGTYWWEGGQLMGGTFPQVVSAAGGVPTFPTTSTDCSVLYPSHNPATGDFLFVHSVCVPGQGDGDGIYLYPPEGSATPTQVVASAHVEGSVDVSLRKPVWFPDGTGFLFMGGLAETDWSWALLAYDGQTGSISVIVAPPAGASVYGVAIAPDASKLVYCLRQGDTGAEDLHLMDLTANPVTDTALTHDGNSCDPVL